MAAVRRTEDVEAAGILPLVGEQLGNLRDQTAREGSGNQDLAKQDPGEGQGYQDSPPRRTSREMIPYSGHSNQALFIDD